jgi:hypothetical protein
MKQVTVSLDHLETRLAFKLGEGDLGRGIRRAVVLASLRSELTGQRQSEIMDHLTIVTNQMEALAEELKQLENDPARREQIATELVRLGRLYLTIGAGGDSSVQDR